eukprot:COSAG02_NODE_251_length_27002_cov_13.799242_25_plen_573_part_00
MAAEEEEEDEEEQEQKGEQVAAKKKLLPAPSAGRSSWADGDAGETTRSTGEPDESLLAWDIALGALMGTDSREYEGCRPVVVEDSAKMQVFLERPPLRRAPGGDKWRFSGGRRGGQFHLYRDNLGVRKRYGMVIRGGDATGREPLKFMCFSLLKRASPDATWAENRDVILYVVAGVTDKPPKGVAPGAVTAVEQPAATPVNSGSLFEGRSMRPTAIETIDMRASEGFYANVLRSFPWRLPEESAPTASTPEGQGAGQQRRRHLEPANTVDATRPWPVSGESDTPDPELDTDWDPRQTDDSGMNAVQFGPFDPFGDEFDALDPGSDTSWDLLELESVGGSLHADEDGSSWMLERAQTPPQPEGSARDNNGMEVVWARQALESVALHDPTVDRAEVEGVVDSVAEVMRNLSIGVEASPVGELNLTPPAREGRGHGQALPTSYSPTGRSSLPAGNSVRECLELHAELFQDSAAERPETVRPEWAASCLTARGGNVGLAAELLGKYMQWRDKYDIVSEGQPSSKRMQVGPGHALTGMQLVSLPLQSALLLVCSVKESDRLGWFVQAILQSGAWYCT